MKITLVTMLTSKKFIAMAIAVVVYLAGTLLGVDKEAIDKIYTAILVYVGAQGVADAGKSAALARAVAENAAKVGGGLDALSRMASKISLVALVLLGAGLSLQQAGCASGATGRATAAGVVAAFDCEAAHLDEQLLADAKALAKGKVEQWLADGARPSSAEIRADLSPIKTDLVKCAVVGAIAAALALLPASHPTARPSALAASSPGSPDSSGPSRSSLREAYGEARRELGWSAVRLADGTVL